MTAWQDIVAIFDAAGPLQLVFDGDPVAAGNGAEASKADKPAQSARDEASSPQKDRATPARRRGRSSLSAGVAEDSSAIAPPPPDASAPPPPAAAPAGASDFPRPSHSGGSEPKKDRRQGAGRDATERRNRHDGGGRFTPRDAAALDRELAFFPQTDLGNAERFRERNRGRLIFCPAIGWFYWDGKRWARDGADERVKIAEHETVRSIQDEADAVVNAGIDFVVGTKGRKGQETDLNFSDTLRAWGRTSEAANRLSPIAKRASAYLAVAPDDLDADPYIINVLNGALRINRSVDGYIEFSEHNPADLITKLAPVEYKPRAICPKFDAFLAEVQAKADMRRFLLAWMGYSLTADVTEQKLCMFWGKGKNGKSVFVEACAYVAGDYSETVPIETFLNEGRSRNAGQATPDLAILPGVRMLRTSEPDRGAKLAEALIKLATGGEPVLARHLNRDYFKFYPQFKLTISGNYRPQITGTDEGIWRRVMLVPWTYTVPVEKRDKYLGRKLREEASGILNRLLDGLRDYLDHGLVPPDDVDRATAEYRRDSDPCGRFLEACVRPKQGARIQSSVLHAVYVAWAKVNGAPEWSNKGLSAALSERGFQKIQSDVMFWTDVELLKTVADFLDPDGKPIHQSAGRDRQEAADDLVF